MHERHGEQIWVADSSRENLSSPHTSHTVSLYGVPLIRKYIEDPLVHERHGEQIWVADNAVYIQQPLICRW